MRDRPYNVLFLCRANSVRSITAEMILNLESHGRFRAFSAGSQPLGSVDPHVIDLGRSLGYPVDTLRSKGIEEFSREGAPDIDLLITLADPEAGEASPAWSGHTATAEWHFPDLMECADHGAAREQAFRMEFRQLSERIHFLLLLSESSLDRMALQSHARAAARPA
ncbi:MAG: arsenate reductase ArsC [Hydrogenophilales bacterium]|nr:arsenate reductase ArsC [Hydrogenophilales bacterium]